MDSIRIKRIMELEKELNWLKDAPSAYGWAVDDILGGAGRELGKIRAMREGGKRKAEELLGTKDSIIIPDIWEFVDYKRLKDEVLERLDDGSHDIFLAEDEGLCVGFERNKPIKKKIKFTFIES